MNFGSIIKNTVGSSVEKEAYDRFGAAVQDFSVGSLSGAFKTAPSKPDDITKVAQQRENAVWDPTHYASALTMAGGFNPRFKFLFKVRFEFHPKIRQTIEQYSAKSTSELERDLTFIVKSVDKPKFDFQYEEVNMYNFRTKVLKRIEPEDISLAFYDDVTNNVFDFFNMYVQALKPVTRIPNAGQHSNSLEEYGFTFSTGPDAVDSSYRAAFSDVNNILSRIIIYQFDVIRDNNTSGSVQDRVRTNKFIFTNPRITNLNLDDLNHEESTLTAATIKFGFDALHMESNISTKSDTDSGKFPEHPKGDILFSVGENGPELGKRGQEISQTGKKLPFVDVITRQGQRAASQALTGIVDKQIGKTKFGQSKIGRAIMPTFSTVGSMASSSVGGALQNASQQAIGGMTLGVSQAFAKPSIPKIKDVSAGSSFTADRVMPEDMI